MARSPDHLAFPLCTSKQKGLAIKNGNLARCYIVENTMVIGLLIAGSEKTRGEKMKVSSIMLLKTNGEKMSEIDLSIMLMKRKVVTVAFPLY
jgi:hypothetical protein